MHELLPIERYRMPLIHGPFTFIVTSRGCPAGCTYCIKHVSYQYGARLRSPEKLMEELWQLKKMGLNNIHMYADLFTVNRDQVMGLCKRMIEERIDIKWTCNSRVDYVDEEMLQTMHEAGNWLISWGIESGNEQILRHARKGAYPDKAVRGLKWAKEAGIKNWGYFIIGLPGETVEAHDGSVFVDGRRLIEPYLPDDAVQADFGVIVVPEGHVFVMGDHRDNSVDSRRFGPVDVDSVVGRAFAVIWPPGRATYL
jgi:radical SAM superfamily enzyme YgiQ (UPF0313 family)